MIAAFTNHLWQSTIFAILAAVLTLTLRKNRAQVRYWLWLCTSVKFLIPFAMLASLGGMVQFSSAREVAKQIAVPAVSDVIEQIAQPFPDVLRRAPESSGVDWVLFALLAFWACGFASLVVVRLRGWLHVRDAVRTSVPWGFAPASFRSRLAGMGHIGIDVRCAPGLLEPGVVGLFRPVLLLPAGIEKHLTARQLDAVLAHELCHVQRRDNLTSAFHMAVEAVFWFHPLVWWIGARMIAERERACDEEVIGLGNDPAYYAEGILNVCKRYVQSPLRCVAGVSGANLRKRIEGIMTNRVGYELNPGRKLLLAGAGMLALAGPIVIGLLNAPPIQAQARSKGVVAFDVASVKLHTPGDRVRASVGFVDGRFVLNGPVLWAISFAYGIPLNAQLQTRLTGTPEWAGASGDAYDIEAAGTFPPGLSDKARLDQARIMLQALLADRFKLKIHTLSKEVPVYALVAGKGGPKLQKADIEEKDCPEGPPPQLVLGAPVTFCHAFNGGRGRGLHARAADMSDLVNFVSNWTDRPLLDKTGVKGLYSFDTTGWLPMEVGPTPAPGTKQDGVDVADIPTIFELFSKLGLRMDSTKDNVDVYVIDHVERPSEN